MPSLNQVRAAALATLRQGSVQTTLETLGFIQADPIRAPARAQDLTLMQRVPAYRAGDLERLYPSLNAEEDVLPNYGFFPREVQAALHPREVGPLRIEQDAPGLLENVLGYVRRRFLEGQVELTPRQVQAELKLKQVSNAWGGQSAAGTRALEGLHYQGHLRVTRRVSGVRHYGPAPHLQALRNAPRAPTARARQVVHLLTELYGPLPQASLGGLLSLCGYGLPHLKAELRAALTVALKEELSAARIDGVNYVWSARQPWEDAAPGVHIVGPFDPLVWDRRRFAHLHGWTYRLEAYTPAPKRVLGYYALPIFSAENAVGWANLKVVGGKLNSELNFVSGVRQTARLKRGLEAELQRYRVFLGLET